MKERECKIYKYSPVTLHLNKWNTSLLFHYRIIYYATEARATVVLGDLSDKIIGPTLPKRLLQ
uniref:Uncharacterized protein n=1 Tax=Arundo donax TaxID=35708 RepID=A0A0A9DMC7_ARUDO